MWNDTTIGSFSVAATKHRRRDRRRARGASRNTPAIAARRRLFRATRLWVGQLRTTCVPTLLSGGHAENALPQSATVTVNCRDIPGRRGRGRAGAIAARSRGPTSKSRQVDAAFSSDASPLRADVMAAVTAAVHASYPERARFRRACRPGATDGVYFRAAGIPTYGAGGMFMKLSDEFSHGLNERIPVDGFYNGLTHWRVLITNLAGRR